MRIAIVSALLGTSISMLAIAACGANDNVQIPDSDGGTDATTATDGSSSQQDASASSDAGSATDGSPTTDAGTDAETTSCPANAPAGGGACDKGADCTYGNDPRFSCRVHATCPDGGWNVLAPPCSAPPSCPATEPPVDAACATEGTTCGYNGDTTCVCTACVALCIGNPTFHCSKDPQGCPATAPNLGTPCDSDASCDYGACTSGVLENCVNGVWTKGFTACPL